MRLKLYKNPGLLTIAWKLYGVGYASFFTKQLVINYKRKSIALNVFNMNTDEYDVKFKIGACM